MSRPVLFEFALALPRRLLAALFRLWQLSFSLVLPPACRFSPSCSAYGIEAVQRHGAVRGGWLTLGRLARCHPFGGCGGYDPVPGGHACENHACKIHRGRTHAHTPIQG